MDQQISLLSRYFFPLHNSFLLAPTCALIAGILWFSYDYDVAFFAAFIFFGLLVNYLSRSTWVMFSMLFMPLGALLTHYQQYRFEQFHQKYQNTVCTLRGAIIEKIYSPEKYFPHVTTLNSLIISRNNTTCPSESCNKLCTLYSKKPITGDIMDTIEIKNVKINKVPPSSFMNYMIRNGIYISSFVTQLESTCIYHPVFSLRRELHQLKERLRTSFKTKLTPTTYHLFATLFLGYKHLNKKKVTLLKEQFNTWGIAHHLARSGLHVVIIILLLELILRCIPLYYTKKQFLMVALIGIYHLLSWPTISFYRAITIFLLHKLCAILLIPTNLIHLISLICITTLLINPYHLFFLDFQLSFGLTFAIAWLHDTQRLMLVE